jgi:tetratricopeptide (TPR) repeat protein
VVASSNYYPPSSPAGYPAGAHGAAVAPGALDSVRQLVDQAEALYLRAPELTLVLGERAAALAESAGSDELWIHAESLVVSAKVRLGDRPGTVGRAVAALRAAEDAGYTAIAARLRIDLAVCARSVGAPLNALAALRPVLANAELAGAQRAEALCHLVGCMAQFGRKAELDRVLVEADRLCSSDESMDADALLLQRALLRVGTSAHRRRHGDLTAAADAARSGIAFLDRMQNPEDDGGLVRIRLILQLACTLLDRGDTEMALEISQPLLAAPSRAAGVGPAGWLRLAIATRVHLPAGSGEAATMLLREAVYDTDQHGLNALTAKLWLELAQLEERLGRPSEAIECLHRSRAAEHLHGRVRRQAFSLLSGEFGSGQQVPVDLDEVLAMNTKRPAPTLVRPVERPTERRADRRAAERAAERPVEKPVEPQAERAVRAPVERQAERQTERQIERPVERQAEPPIERPVERPAPEIAVLPELQLAPAPAAEPAPRVTIARDPEPPRPPEPKAAEPKAPESSAQRWDIGEAARRERQRNLTGRTTRHDSDHGSVAARSVLDRLGISSGGGGGRRRATDENAPGEPPKSETPKPEPVQPEPVRREPEPPVAESWAPAPAPEPAPAPPRAPEPAPGIREEQPAKSARLTDDEYRDQVADPWLPRLKMPPSLEPLEDQAPAWTPSDNYSDSKADFGSPFSDNSYARAVAEDEPAPDAGLAELLARALAEHQAGTASAAALVKRLGSKSDEPAESRPVNGHRRTGAMGPDSGRHRTGE